MKRVWLCIGIFMLIIAMSAGSIALLSKGEREMSQQIDFLALCYEQGDNSTEEKITQLEQYWEKICKPLSLAVSTCELNEISCLVSQLKSLYLSGSEDFLPQCIGIKKRIQLACSNRLPRFWTIL